MPDTDCKFLQIPKSLLSDRSFRSSDVRVLSVLFHMRNEDREVDAGLDAITEQTGLSKRTVCEAITRLEERGFLQRDSRRGPYTGLIKLDSSVNQFYE